MESKSFYRKLRIIFGSVTVEPAAFCYMFPAYILFTVTQNFNLEKACRVNLNYSTSVCDALVSRNKSGYNAIEEQRVQFVVASVNGYSTGLQGFLICFSLLIIGSWSDKNHKRKPLLFLPLIGDIISAFFLLLSLVFYNQLPVEFNAFAEAVPQGLAGGHYSLMTAVFAYLGEYPNIERRTIKIGATDVVMLIALYTGLAVGGMLYNQIKLYQIYVIIIVIHLLGIAYTHFKIEEIRHRETQSEMKTGVLLDIFNLNHVKKTFIFAFSKGKRLKKIWMTLSALWGSYGPWQGR